MAAFSSKLLHPSKRKPGFGCFRPMSRMLPLVTVLAGIWLVMYNSPTIISGLGFPSSYISSYDLAHLLNVSAIFDRRRASKRATALSFPDTLAYRYATSSSTPGGQRHCSVRPFPSHLHALLTNYLPPSSHSGDSSTTEHANFESDLNLAKRQDVITVQVCLGDCEKLSDDDDFHDDHFVHRIRIYSRGFRTALIVPSFSSYSSSPSSPSSPAYYNTEKQIKDHPLIQRVSTSLHMRRRLAVVIASSQTFKHADSRVAVLHAAHHPILHRGSEAALVALAISGRPANGTVKIYEQLEQGALNDSQKFTYTPDAFSDGFFATEAFRSYLKSDFFLHAVYDSIRATKRPRHDIAILSDGMGRVQESCCQFTPFGEGDGAKMLCAEALGSHVKTSRTLSDDGYDDDMLDVGTGLVAANKSTKVDCWIFSIGCGGRWSFEADIAFKTGCAVHVFDCTGNFSVPSEIAHRVRHDKLCVGPAGADRENGFRTWPELLEIGATQAGLAKDTAPLAVKMDVEGWEFPVLYALEKEVKNQAQLPRQIVMEVHTYTHHPVGPPFKKNLFKMGRNGIDTQDVAHLFGNLSSMGYSLVHRADNPYCGHCSEVTLLHKDAFPPIV